MPKQSKLKILKDFKKTKVKIGKKKPIAVNATKTDFKTKSIIVPTQHDEKSQFTTSRKLDYRDLVSQLKHHNFYSRRDALSGLRELFQRFPLLLLPHLAETLNNILQLIADPNVVVRQGLQSLVHSMTSQLKELHIHPFFPLIVVYFSSGLTHSEEPIRNDTLVLINMFFDRYPKSMVQYSHKLFPNYLLLLSNKSIVNSIGLKGRLTLLRSLQKFFSILIEESELLTSNDSSTSSLASTLVIQSTATVNSAVDNQNTQVLYLPYRGESKREEGEEVVTARDLSYFKEILELVRDSNEQFFKLMLELWYECSPLEFVGQAVTGAPCDPLTLQSLITVLTVLGLYSKTLNLAYSSLQPQPDYNQLFSSTLKESLVRHVLICFPFPKISEKGEKTNKDNVKKKKRKEREKANEDENKEGEDDKKDIGEDTEKNQGSDRGVEMNIIVCEIMANFFQTKSAMKKTKSEKKKKHWSQHILEYLTNLLLKPSSVSKALCGRVLSCLRRLLSLPLTSDQRTLLLNSFTVFFRQSHPNSSTKRECILFIHSILTDANFKWLVHICLKEWIPLFPELLIGQCQQNTLTAQKLLGVLNYCANSPNLNHSFNGLQSSLNVLFSPGNPDDDSKKSGDEFEPKEPKAKRTKTEKANQEVKTETDNKSEITTSPFLTLHPRLQKLILHLFFSFNNLSTNTLQAMALCCSSPKADLDVVSDVLETVYNHMFLRTFDAEKNASAFLGFALTLLTAAAFSLKKHDMESEKKLERTHKLIEIVANLISLMTTIPPELSESTLSIVQSSEDEQVSYALFSLLSLLKQKIGINFDKESVHPSFEVGSWK